MNQKLLKAARAGNLELVRSLIAGGASVEEADERGMTLLMMASEFLRNLIQAVPYKIHKVLTDNGIQFTNHDHHKNAFTNIFERVCNEYQKSIARQK